ncbi:hypothetical protein [Cohnella mopanensis]|uniref:hypothetical protein n=1 Tax=Cohnella mopanensis TaxID=2911966 RepID=UPI001EF93C04|nr:hypothetical protein [Cohnella mopanensis]
MLTAIPYEIALDWRLSSMAIIVKEGKILDVAMSGNDSSVFINGLEVKGNDFFYDIVMPFLPEDSVNEFDKWTNRGQAVEDSSP